MSEKNWKAGTGQTIAKLYAWIATEADGGEGVCAHNVVIDGREMMAALVGADRARIESYRSHAEAVARLTGCTVRLKVFGTGTVIDEIAGKDST
jgi:hypothetical protein